MRKAVNRAVVTKSGSLNFLEPSGPVQARNGTALPLPLLYDTLIVLGCFGSRGCYYPGLVLFISRDTK